MGRRATTCKVARRFSPIVSLRHCTASVNALESNGDPYDDRIECGKLAVYLIRDPHGRYSMPRCLLCGQVALFKRVINAKVS